jgi:hypothetical protein
MDKRIGRHMVMHFAVERSFWSSDEPDRHTCPWQSTTITPEGNAFHVRFRQQNRIHAAMRPAGDAGRGVGGGLSDE